VAPARHACTALPSPSRSASGSSTGVVDLEEAGSAMPVGSHRLRATSSARR
jgi:hypothetical protein